ncbi:uncharacterized protein LOC125583276 [Brassica napus]|uniref:uncharacterized protein LOC125583276 n=1 Tax=Brassica napus TaxID=3708 RepID=UPI002079710F|nr:uncharacterized protein LOC125583276 [Brassica napus]
MDLILDEEKHMFALTEETYGVAEVNTNKELVRTNRGGGWRRVQRFMNESEVQCYDILRMNQSTFNSLCKLLSEKYQLVESVHVYLEESVAMFLEMVGQDLTVRALAERYQHSSGTVKRKLDEVLSSLLKLAADIVKPGRDEFASVSPILVDDPQYYPFFKDCIGALDGTHMPVRPPSVNVEPFRGRKGEPTMNVLAICNFSMKFIYAYVGVPGRAHDTKVLTYCAKEEASFPHPPVGKYYLVDSGYPTRTGYLGPHSRTRYHLDQFVRGGPPTAENYSTESILSKWRVLDHKHPKYDLTKWVKIMTATMALHNFIRDSNHEDCDFAHWKRVEEYEHRGDEVTENDDHVAYIPAGDRVMEAMRDSITEEMARGRRLPY